MVDSGILRASDNLGPLGDTFEVSSDGNDFYQEVSFLPFIQSSHESFINSDDSLKFLGQSGSQMLVLDDGIPQKSITSIGGSRSYHYLDPFFFDSISVNTGGSSATLGTGAFSGAISLQSKFNLGTKYMFQMGSFGQQKIGLKSGVRLKRWLSSFEFLSSSKSGPSLSLNKNGTELEEDSRQLYGVRIKVKESSSSSIGPYFQFNYYRDKQDFDQFMLDDGRPFGDQTVLELIAKNKMIFGESSILSTTARLQKNRRFMLNVLGDEENSLQYNANNIFIRSDFETLDYFIFDSLSGGIELNYDFNIEITEIEKAGPNEQLEESAFLSARLNLSTLDEVNMSSRLTHAIGQLKVMNQASYEKKIDQQLVKFKFFNDTRFPSLYERLSIYGTPDLRTETNFGAEASVKKQLSSGSVNLLAYYQYQKNLIYFDGASSLYLNKLKNKLAGISFGLDMDVSDYRLSLLSSYAYVDTKELRLNHSPLKLQAGISKRISSKLKVEMNEIFHGKRQLFGGEKIDFSLTSQLIGSYILGPNMVATIRSSLLLNSNKDSQHNVILTLTGRL